MAFRYRAWPRTKGISSWAQRAASQVPREETFDRDHAILAGGRHDLEQGVWAGLHSTMPHALPVAVQDADGHRPGVPVDATVKAMWLGVEAPEVSSSPGELFPVPADHGGMRRRGPQSVSTRYSGLLRSGLVHQKRSLLERVLSRTTSTPASFLFKSHSWQSKSQSESNTHHVTSFMSFAAS
jgi:hypothetical protein